MSHNFNFPTKQQRNTHVANEDMSMISGDDLSNPDSDDLLFGNGSSDPDTPKLVISRVGASPIKEGESTVFKVTVEDAPKNHDEIKFCLGFSKNSSATYGVDYTVSDPYKHYDADTQILSDLVWGSQNWDHSCNPGNYIVFKSLIPSAVNTVYYEFYALP